MGITISIQTFNRADELRETLRTLASIDTSGVPEFEVLVIDNNSHDHTASVVEELSPAFRGHLRYVHEPQLGLSHARNRAIAEARYEIVAFLDDDVDIDVNWLRNLAAAFESGEYAVVGGRAYLVYPKARPAWLGERSEGFLTRVEHGPNARPARPNELYGVNLSVRKEWLERAGGFRTDLGRVGNCLLSDEETDLNQRIAEAGGKLLYEPAAIVGHRVPLSRLRRRWFWARCYWGTLGAARRIPDSQCASYDLLRATWWLSRAYWQAMCGLCAHGPGSEEFFYRSRILASRLGYWVGLVARICGSAGRRRLERPVPSASTI
jgi:GT2 family glycosyltransferase